MSRRASLLRYLEEYTITPSPETQSKLEEMGTSVLNKPIKAVDLLRRDEVDSSFLERFGLALDPDVDVREPVEIHVKYSGYIRRQNEMVEQALKMEKLVLPESLSYENIRGLSREEVEKLARVRPRSLGQAGRISGVNPSAIQAIMVHLKGRRDAAIREYSS